MYISGKIIFGNGDLSDAFLIREKVFVEEQRIPEEMEFDDHDSIAFHVIAYEDNTAKKDSDQLTEKIAVATGRLTFDGDICRIGRVAVLKEYRGKRYGDFIVRMLLNKAFSSGIKRVTINTQTSAEEFYRKIGFKRVSDSFMEGKIEHCEMVILDYEVTKECDKNR